MYIRDYHLLYYASRFYNVIVKQCINHAMYDSDLCYKFAFYHYAYNIDAFLHYDDPGTS